MELVLRSPQFHSTFSNLGFAFADGYHVNENCNAALERILQNILTEDKYLRTYRRSVSFGQNIKKDLIPLLIHTKDDTTIELLIRILVNLTIPTECLLSVDVILKTEFERHTIFELNNLLSSTKVSFTDYRATRVIIDFLKKNSDFDQNVKPTEEQCAIISNSLLLLRNILHIPEDTSNQSQNHNGFVRTVQNQILWNLFSQSIDKTLIKLMTLPHACKWAVTMVQVVALLYKDQHVVTLHKLLNQWLEVLQSDSSEDDESNTSPPNRGSDDSLPMLTSDPTSDSSDASGSGNANYRPNSVKTSWDGSSVNNTSDNRNQILQALVPPTEPEKTKLNGDNSGDESMKTQNDSASACGNRGIHMYSKNTMTSPSEKKSVSENSDCGYGTQIENRGSISTSSNEDDVPWKKPVHQKPHNSKQRSNIQARSGISLQERKRKKLVKRGKLNIINVQGLTHETPTDDDILNVLKEFTVDFLLKGYNSLVQTLHAQILTNRHLEIDTSHFFWLVTYFLKFATQIELDFKHVSSVLSFDIVSYLTAEGVNLCEQFELAIKLDGNDLKPIIRRLHLVVTSIREFVQAVELYKKMSYLQKEDQETLSNLQLKIYECEELRSLIVLLLRHHNPKYHSKQYLQDLIVTNHILLMFLDSVMKSPEYTGSTYMFDHIRQFATTEIMSKYGTLLEDYASNGEFVNDCIFTIMHHVGGATGSLTTLFQPKILKAFTSICQSEFEICDDWTDLIEAVVNTFVKKPMNMKNYTFIRLVAESFEDDEVLPKHLITTIEETHQEKSVTPEPVKNDSRKRLASGSSKTTLINEWTEDEISSLRWNYLQCNVSSDVISEIVTMFKEDGVIKTRDSLIKQLYKQNVIDKSQYDKYMKVESENHNNPAQIKKYIWEDEIGNICEQLTQDGKSKFLDWVQKVLLELCYVKIYLEKSRALASKKEETKEDFNIMDFELFKRSDETHVLSPVSYHALLHNQPIPLVPWNCEQAGFCKDLKFLQLLHKLGFYMPVDTGKVFIRIPHFWNAEYLYEFARKILPIDTSKLKFSLSDLSEISQKSVTPQNSPLFDLRSDPTMLPTPEVFYQIHKQKHLATMVNFTPMPGSSFNNENKEESKQNWFEIVRKSQEYKITLNVSTLIQQTVATTSLSDTVVALPHADMSSSTIEIATAAADKHESGYIDSNNSVWDTASVASDLTRMYVSDEDEKPEVLLRPVIIVSADQDDQISDTENTSPEKKARLTSPVPDCRTYCLE